MSEKKPAKTPRKPATKARAKPLGRPSKYTKKVGDAICARLADGEPLRQICRDPDMPAWRTVYDWKAADADFAARIAHAREAGHDAIAQECLEIADTPQIGETIEISPDGKKVKREDMLGHRKLQVETRLKLLAKWDPKRYGDKMTQELTGAGGGPIQHQVAQMSDDELDAAIAKAAAAAGQ